MHQVLHIPEILQLIFVHLIPDEYIKALGIGSHGPFKSLYGCDRTTLRNLAVTCRAFKELALDALWWAMDDIEPLFALLSGFQKREDSSGNIIKVIRGSICQSDLERFSAYAKRIKFYYLYDYHLIPTSSLLQILRACNRTYLLPSLKYLFCTSSTEDLPFFLSPTLLELRAFFKSPAEDLDHFRSSLGSLAQMTPRLQGISLNCAITPECLESISRLPGLEYVFLSNCPVEQAEEDDASTTLFLDYNFVWQLWSSSGDTLSFFAIEGDIEFLVEEPTLCLTFTNLKALGIRPNGQRDILSFLNFFKMTTFPSLTGLVIDNHDAAGEGSFRVTWSALIKRILQATTSNLQRLELACPRPSSGLSLKDVPEILKFKLTLFGEDFLEALSIADVWAMARAWPSLTDLSLRPEIGYGQLLEIARAFRQLRRLRITCGSNILPESPKDEWFFDHHPVQHLTLRRGSSLQLPLPNPENFAMTLDRLFPDAQMCSLQPPGEWIEVYRFFSFLRRARAETMTRIRLCHDLVLKNSVRTIS